jgi:hypothetical protein
VSVPRGAVATPNPVRLRMPALGVRVQRNGGTPSATAEVFIKPVATSCVGTKAWQASSTNSFTVAPTTSSPMATKQDHAFPPGDYTICADTRVGTNNSADRRTLTVSNNNENGQLITVNIETSSNSNGNSDGHCSP